MIVMIADPPPWADGGNSRAQDRARRAAAAIGALPKKVELVIRPDLADVRQALDAAVVGVNVDIANAAVNLLDRVDQHVAEVAEPLFCEERDALRAALRGSE